MAIALQLRYPKKAGSIDGHPLVKHELTGNKVATLLPPLGDHAMNEPALELFRKACGLSGPACSGI